MGKEEIESLLNDAAKGNFEQLYKSLIASIDKINGQNVMRILARCSIFCKEKQVTRNVQLESLYKIVKLLGSEMQETSEKEFNNYLASLYHCMKSFITKNSIEYILGLQDIAFPSTSSSTYNNTYHSLAQRLYTMSSSIEVLDVKLTQLIRFILKLCKEASNPKLLLDVASYTFTHLNNLKASTKDLEQHCFYFLELSTDVQFDTVKDHQFKVVVSMMILITVNYLKLGDFQSIKEFLEKIERATTTICKHEEFKCVSFMFRFIVLLSPYQLENKLENVKRCRKFLNKLNIVWDIANIKSSLLTNFLIMIQHVVNYYQKKNSKEWCEFTEELQIEFFSYMYELFLHDCEQNNECSCKCKVSTAISKSVKYFQPLCSLLILSVKGCPNLSQEFHRKCLDLFSEFSFTIKILKESKCEQWKTIWNTFGIGIYNIGQAFIHNRLASLYYCMLIKQYLNFQWQSDEVLKQEYILNAMLSLQLIHSEEFRKVFAICAAAIYFLPNKRETFIGIWIKTKYNLGDTNAEYKSITLVQAFEKLLSEIRFITGTNIGLTPKKKTELLIFELDSYKSKWKSKVPIMAALKELHKVADLNQVVKMIVQLFGECDMEMNKEVGRMVNEVLDEYEKIVKKDKECNRIYLSILYFILYKCKIVECINQHCEEMEQNMKIVESSDQQKNEFNEENPKCDIVSSYQNLELEKFHKYIKLIDKSLDHMLSAFSEANSKNLPFNLYNILMKIALEYKLICYRLKSVQALELALKVAQFEKNPLKILRTINCLIQNPPNLKSVESWISIAEDNINQLDLDDLQDLKIALTYYIFKAEAYINEDCEVFKTHFKYAQNLFEKEVPKRNDFDSIKSYMCLLRLRYIKLPTRQKYDNILPKITAAMEKTFLSLAMRSQHIKLNQMEEMVCLFDFAEELAKFFHTLKQPVNVRRYCSEVLIIAQKLILPLRCVTFLTHIGLADMYCNHFDDCKDKLRGISNILSIPKYNIDVQSDFVEETDYDKQLDGVTNKVRQMAISFDETPLKHFMQTSPSSPVLEIESFRMPPFFKHEKFCKCFSCLCLEYQLGVFMKMKLDVVYNTKKNFISMAMDLYNKADEFYEKYLTNYKRQNTSNDGALKRNYEYLNGEFLSTYGYILVHNSKFTLTTLNKKDECLIIINKLKDLVTPVTSKCSDLYLEALMLQFAFLKLPTVPTVPVITINDSDENECEEIIKTPDSKHSAAICLESEKEPMTPWSPIPISKHKKRLIFDCSPDIPKPEPLPQRLRKPALLLNSAKKIQVYRETPSKFTNIKKKDLKEDHKMENDKPLMKSEQPDDIRRKTRAKLLTEILKESAKKPEGQNAEIKSKGGAVKKSLSSQLDKTEKVVKSKKGSKKK